MIRIAGHLTAITLLTLITQLGGLAWLAALLFRRRFLAFCAAYLALSLGAVWVAPLTGRVPLPCLAGGALQMQSPLYCALNRHYVTPELAEVLTDYASQMNRRFDGTTTLVLDANFPFVNGYPLLPHLSHHDGRKADIAFYYRNEAGYLDRTTRAPFGYFAFQDGPTTCPDNRLTLRWDMAWLQPLWPDLALDPQRMETSLRLLAADPRVGKLFIEPHLKQRFAPQIDKIRFQGCRAARHDDHIHIQL
ncbi:hypothetical protein [uncultured Sulfitobacter sp.]|uniref:hypothetical protein n=1 Tax=uncultured Sulfitobacter sp. TaxID=191468 RepID=UPI00261C604D|nr:hypothetical protein [uncultured Sulfitobacter sp.]